MSGVDWLAWHRRYDDPGEGLHERLQVVQRLIREWLDGAPPGPLRVVSACAGQGRDLLGVLAGHSRRDDVHARLVELDPRNTAPALAAVREAGLRHVDVVTGDASWTDAYLGAVPANLVLMCGVFGNVSDADVEQTVRLLPGFCAPRGVVVWTRGRRHPDLTPSIRRWFAETGFTEQAFASPGLEAYAVGMHRLGPAARASPLQPGKRLFEFLPRDA
jgi:Putative methyltransferase